MPFNQIFYAKIFAFRPVQPLSKSANVAYYPYQAHFPSLFLIKPLLTLIFALSIAQPSLYRPQIDYPTPSNFYSTQIASLLVRLPRFQLYFVSNFDGTFV